MVCRAEGQVTQERAKEIIEALGLAIDELSLIRGAQPIVDEIVDAVIDIREHFGLAPPQERAA